MNNDSISPKKKDYFIKVDSKKPALGISFRDIFNYRDLLFLFVRRDFVAIYKQTVFGPLWFIIQPLLITITFSIIFGNLAQISTDGLPKVLFYLGNVTIWNYFADCLTKTSNVFVENQNLFGKVYFPRLLIPVGIVINNLFKFCIQLAIFFGFWFYYFLNGSFTPNVVILLFPLLLLIMAMLGLGLGLIITSSTIKYRDLRFLVSFGVQILMYASPVVYPISFLPDEYKIYAWLNPITSVIETFKYGFLGVGTFDLFWVVYSLIVSVALCLIGVSIFNKVERSFIDTV